jgi:hypothetical protein
MACAPGFGCYPGYDFGVPICEKSCSTDADCNSPGGKCLDSISGNPPYDLCTVNCNPITSTVCPAGDACRLGTTDGINALTFCGGTGAGIQDDPCDFDSDCVAGFVCYPSSFWPWNTCQQYCTNIGGLCSSGFTCYSLGLALGTVTYGSCD